MNYVFREVYLRYLSKIGKDREAFASGVQEFYSVRIRYMS
jgi:hypothetical protein